MIAFLFSGQGAQKPGMAKALYDASPAARRVFDDVSEAAGRDIAALCFSGEQAQLNETINTQPAMLAADLAAWAALDERGVKADLCAGFSLGEFAAIVCAGVLSVRECAALVCARARFMSEAQEGGMAAVLGVDAEEVEAVCASVASGFVVPVNYNCPGQTVIAGQSEALAEAIAAFKAKKIRALPLAVSGAFHSRLMQAAADRLYDEMASGRYAFSPPRIPIVCNVSARAFDPECDAWPENGRAHTASPVLWEKSVRALIDLGADVFCECGPGKVLAGFNKRICPEKPTFAIEDDTGLDAAATAILCENREEDCPDA